MDKVERSIRFRLVGVLAGALLSLAAHAGGGDATAASSGEGLKPGPDSDLDIFAFGFLNKAAGDEAFRDACAEDLDSCLEAAGRSAPGGTPMEYTYDAQSGHTLVYKTSFGGTRTVQMRPGEPLEMKTEGGFAGRTTKAVYDVLVEYCWVQWGDCAKNEAICSCEEGNRVNVYPCTEDPSFWMSCPW